MAIFEPDRKNTIYQGIKHNISDNKLFAKAVRKTVKKSLGALAVLALAVAAFAMPAPKIGPDLLPVTVTSRTGRTDAV